MKTTINGVTYIVGFQHTTKTKGYTRTKDKTTGAITFIPKVYDDKTICTVKRCDGDTPTIIATAAVRRHPIDTPNRVIANNAAFRKAITLVEPHLGASLVPLINELREPASGYFGTYGA